MPHANVWFWLGFLAFILAMLAVDLGIVHRQPHEVRPKEASAWTAIWVALALAFAGLLAIVFGRSAGLTFLTGYVIEEALSVDNLFVIVLIFEYFRVPKVCQHRVLFYGILGALAMRGLFIGTGAFLIARFHWILYLFGAMLVVTGVRMAIEKEEDFAGEENRVVRFVRKVLPITADFRGKHFFVLEGGRRLATPLLLVLVLVEVTDLVFAIDSIPATFGVTTNPFLVFTSNIFAVLGLRTLYFLVAAVMDRFYLLRYALAGILSFIGVKMLGDRFFQVDIGFSLAIVLVALAAAVAASAMWPETRR